MSQRCYDTTVATEYGVNCAVFIQYLQYRIFDKMANGENFFDGRHWTYNSVSSLHTYIYPHWSAHQIEYIIRKLVKKRVIVLGNFNKTGYDRTRWFAFVDEEAMLAPLMTPREKTITFRQENRTRRQGESPLAPVDNFKSAECVKTPLPSHRCPETRDFKHLGIFPNQFGNFPRPIPLDIPLDKALVVGESLRGENKLDEDPVDNFKPVDKCGGEVKEGDELAPALPMGAGAHSTPSPSPAVKPTRVSKNGTRLADDWELPDEWREWSLQAGVTETDIEIFELKFKNYWLSTTKNPTKLNWFMTWKNWCVSDYERKGRNIREPSKTTLKAPPIGENSFALPPYRAPPRSDPENPSDGVLEAHKQTDDPIVRKWYDEQPELSRRLTEPVYRSWFLNLRFEGLLDGVAYFTAPNRFLADMIMQSYSSYVVEILREVIPDFHERDILVGVHDHKATKKSQPIERDIDYDDIGIPPTYWDEMNGYQENGPKHLGNILKGIKK